MTPIDAFLRRFTFTITQKTSTPILWVDREPEPTSHVDIYVTYGEPTTDDSVEELHIFNRDTEEWEMLYRNTPQASIERLLMYLARYYDRHHTLPDNLDAFS